MTNEDGKSKREKEQKLKKEHIALGIGMGVALGAGIGVAIANIAIGIAIGVAMGPALGLALARQQEKKAKNTLPPEPKIPEGRLQDNRK